MKRAILAVLLLVAGGLAAFLAYDTATREAEYRRLIANGQASLTAGQTFSALESFSGAIALKGESMLPYLKRGETYRVMGDFEAALRDLRVAARLDPAATRPLEEIGDVNYARERWANAAQSYGDYLKLDERAPRVHYKLALTHLRQGHTAAAISALNQALGQLERYPEAHCLLGICLAEMDRLPEAVTALERSVELAPALPAPREELARLYERLRRNADAIQQLEALAALEPGRLDRIVAVALAYGRDGRTDLAVMKLGQAAERFPDSEEVYLALGRIWLANAEAKRDRAFLGKAVEAISRVVRSATADSEAFTLLARAHLHAGELQAAYRVLHSAVERKPVDPAAYLHLARAAERMGKPAEARDALVAHAALLEADTLPVELALQIAGLSARIGQNQDAVAWLRRAASVSDSVEILVQLATAEIRTGALEAARVTVERGLDKEPGNRALIALSRQLR